MNTKRPFRLITWEKFGPLKTSKWKGEEWQKYWIELYGFKISHIHSARLKAEKHIHQYMQIYKHPGQLFIQFQAYSTLQTLIDHINSNKAITGRQGFGLKDYRSLLEVIKNCYMEHRLITPDEFEPFKNKFLLEILKQ